MEARPVSGDEAAKKVGDLYDKLDAKKVERLELAQLFHTIKKEMGGLEVSRMKKKYGTKHYRSEKAAGVVLDNKNMVEALDMQIRITKANAEPNSKTGWSIHGFVNNENGQALAGFFVSLTTEKEVNPNQQWMSKTDENGFYSLQLDGDVIDSLVSQRLFLIVLSKNKKIIQREKNVLLPVPGVIDIQDIEIAESQLKNDR